MEEPLIADRIVLCRAEDLTPEATTGLRDEALEAIDWTLDALDRMVVGGDGVMTEIRERGLGYVERSMDDDEYEEIIRIRRDSSSTEPDVILVEGMRRDHDIGTDGLPTTTTLRLSLERWRAAMLAAGPADGEWKDAQRERAEVVATIVAAIGVGGGRSCVIKPPSLHHRTEILTVGSTGADHIPDEEDLRVRSDASLGGIAWLRPETTSHSTKWLYVPPLAHAFRRKGTGPDAMCALRAFEALDRGMP
jgi:hypothetical protein